jgi:hypothetical protein
VSAPYYADEDVTLYLGDCLDVLRTLPADSIDAIVTDPPAGIAFMGRDWDDFCRARSRFVDMLAERMAEAWRVLKPGGHALVWSIPRTSHWTAWAVEDAGFDLRDCVLHLFGSGFPKSLDVSKAIDKRAEENIDTKRRIAAVAEVIRLHREAKGMTPQQVSLAVVGTPSGACWNWEHQQLPSVEMWPAIKVALGIADDYDALIEGDRAQFIAAEREVIKERTAIQGGGTSLQLRVGDRREVCADITAPATEDAARWEGWGTALKPGQEMWWLARKPLKGTVAANVLEYGTGALNIDGCKVGSEVRTNNAGGSSSLQRVSRVEAGYRPNVTTSVGQESEVTGRWPANIVLTHSAACDGACAPDCPAGELDRQSGDSRSGGVSSRQDFPPGMFGGVGTRQGPMYKDVGGASRFYPTFRYQAKAPASERPRLEDGTAHETVKPLGFISWAARLITPPGGTVLDMFGGSGPVAEACIVEGFRCVIIEKDPKSADLIRKRLSKPIQPVMFGRDDGVVA